MGDWSRTAYDIYKVVCACGSSCTCMYAHSSCTCMCAWGGAVREVEEEDR
jgi:hypothetical protein